LTALALFAVVFVAASSANLPGLTFEGNDGSLVVDTGGNTDWANAPNRVRGEDIAEPRNDNSFGQGTKEDDAGSPVLTLNKWITAADGGAVTDCLAAKALPCWGAKPADDALDGLDDNQIDLSQAGFAEGAVNGTTVTDPIARRSIGEGRSG
jgi:hypothetical protein